MEVSTTEPKRPIRARCQLVHIIDGGYQAGHYVDGCRCPAAYTRRWSRREICVGHGGRQIVARRPNRTSLPVTPRPLTAVAAPVNTTAVFIRQSVTFPLIGNWNRVTS